MSDRMEKIKGLLRYANVLEKQTGKVVRPIREDGFVNVMNNYGTSKDVMEHYQYETDAMVPDEELTAFYESDGLFAKIIDTPAEEAFKQGFNFPKLANDEIEQLLMDALDDLQWEDNGMLALKWARLFGGSIAVLMINDGGDLEDPVDWKNIKSIDGIKVYERAVVQPDYQSIFEYDPVYPTRIRGSRLGMPEYYMVNSQYGHFTVHESRCLIFQNGRLPENTTSSIYQFWGIPEYMRIQRAIRDAEISHGAAPKLLDRSVQAIYKMKNLAEELATEDGESNVLKRLQVIDLAKGMMNSIAIDAEGEEYDYKTISFTGVSEVIDVTCNFVSALTSIPQTILFGRSPAGMSATGESDMENYYNYVKRIQKSMVRRNLGYLLDIIVQAGLNTGLIEEEPNIAIEFNPLWSLSDLELANLEQVRATTQQIKASTAQMYVDMQALDPSEVREELASQDEFNIETMLDEETVDDFELEDGELEDVEEIEKLYRDDANTRGGVGVIVMRDGKILTGRRLEENHFGELCGPGGHIEKDESPKMAAIRETWEEFGLFPENLTAIGRGVTERDGSEPHIFLCTEFRGEPSCECDEMCEPEFRAMEEILAEDKVFEPFRNSLLLLMDALEMGEVDG